MDTAKRKKNITNNPKQILVKKGNKNGRDEKGERTQRRREAMIRLEEISNRINKGRNEDKENETKTAKRVKER